MLCLLLGVVGLVKTDTAVAIAIGAASWSCSATASLAGRRLGLSLRRHASSVGVINGILGLLIVLLKVLVH